ncbi:hypothetical protein QE152_g14011 [Popillia japonica]|uniref:Uncharacterized protein n=1 Tax=Popillia japonica TaxID=7064 RepID=A0AAW1LAV4_POPJA
MPLSAVRERASKALSVRIAAVSRISTDVKKGKELHSPNKRKHQREKPDVKKGKELHSPNKRKHQREKPVVDIDDFAKCAIRSAVYDMYRDKQHITLQSLAATLQKLVEKG